MLFTEAMNGEAASRAKLLEMAVACFGERGFEETSVAQIAERANVPLATAFALYPSKHAFALALYQSVVAETQAVVADLPEAPVGERFAALVEAKLDRLDTRRSAMRALIASAVDAKGPLGVLSASTAAVRARMSGAIHAAVAGATDAPNDSSQLASVLYGVHLAIVLLWTQDDDGRMARGALALCRDLANRFAPLLGALPGASERVGQLEAIFGDRLSPVVSADVDKRARWVLARLMRHRRLLARGAEGAVATDLDDPSESELAVHLPLVRAAIAESRPIELLLPAFPAKSPSPSKVLGKLPDFAEHVALRSLQTLCAELTEAHPPGAHILLCSDGLVFADVVGVADDDVAAYGSVIDEWLKELPLLRRFDLAHAFGNTTSDEARRRLLATWAEPEADLIALAKTSPTLGAQLDGMHRFLFEDGIALHPESSRTQVRKEARHRAVEVLRRSRAWGNLLASLFPQALRLSIHPQPRISDKIGVHLVTTTDAWLTPWHGVALLEHDRVRLVKRADAEALGARAVDAGSPHGHFVLGAS